MDMADFLQTEYKYQGITMAGRDILECYAEKAVIELIQAASFAHSVKKRGFDDKLEVRGPQGEEISIAASTIKLIVKGFLKSKGIETLSLSDNLATLAERFRDYLRTTHREKCLKEKRESNFYLIEKETDLNWLYNICFLALAEYAADKKNKSDNFIDQRSGILAAFAFGMRDVRAFAAEGHNHNMKNKYMKGSEDKEKQNKQDEEDAINKWVRKYEEKVEELSKRGLPDFKLPELPAGIEVPLRLPMGTKKKAS